MIQLVSKAANNRPLLLRFLWRLAIVQSLALPVQASLGLDQAIEIAQQNDPWITGSEFRQEAIEAESIAAGTLPDPLVNVGFANVPTDSFEFNEEPMTQFKVGVFQTFPRGDSLSLRRKQLGQMGSQYPHQRDDRRARVGVNVAQLWLESFRASRSIQLIEDDRDLFEHLVDVAESSYATALGKTRQQDLVRAQLELTRLEDRLEMLRARQEMADAKLLEWLSNSWPTVRLPETLPELELKHPELFGSAKGPAPQQLATYFANHPAIVNIDTMIESRDTGIELAKQGYKPQWTVNAGYGYRDDSPSGQDRPDFLSVGIAFDIPLFTGNKQDKKVQAAIATREATRTEKALLLRSMIASFDTQYARLWRLNQRQELYRSRLLAEMAEQAEASLTAYTNDDGDFAEVVRARIAELNAKIDALDIDIDRLKTISQLNYFFTMSNV